MDDHILRLKTYGMHFIKYLTQLKADKLMSYY